MLCRIGLASQQPTTPSLPLHPGDFKMNTLLAISLLVTCVVCFDVKDEEALAGKALAAFKSDKSNAKRVWWDRLGTANKDFICYEPRLPTAEWAVIGQRGQQNHNDLAADLLAFKQLEDGALARAEGFEFLWDDRYGTNIQDASLWRPQCPTGYVALGDLFYPANYITVPGQDLFAKFRCVRRDLTENCIPGGKVWDDGGSTSWFDVSVWEPLPSEKGLGGYLYGHNQHGFPPQVQMYCLKHTSYGFVYSV